MKLSLYIAGRAASGLGVTLLSLGLLACAQQPPVAEPTGGTAAAATTDADRENVPTQAISPPSRRSSIYRTRDWGEADTGMPPRWNFPVRERR